MEQSTHFNVLQSINSIEYFDKDNNQFFRKELTLQVYRASRFAGKDPVKEPLNGNPKISFFPLRYSRGVLTANEYYYAFDQMENDEVNITFRKFETSPFNFPKDDKTQGPRTSLRVGVVFTHEDTAAKIEEKLINQAQYQLRGTVVEVGDKNKGISIMFDGTIVATAATEAQWNLLKEDKIQRAADRAKALEDGIITQTAADNAEAQEAARELEIETESKRLALYFASEEGGKLTGAAKTKAVKDALAEFVPSTPEVETVGAL